MPVSTCLQRLRGKTQNFISVQVHKNKFVVVSDDKPLGRKAAEWQGCYNSYTDEQFKERGFFICVQTFPMRLTFPFAAKDHLCVCVWRCIIVKGLTYMFMWPVQYTLERQDLLH